MAFRIQIKGNYLVVFDFTTMTDVIRRRTADISFIRQGDYFVFMNSGQIFQTPEGRSSNTLGTNEKVYDDAPDAISQKTFLYSDCQDSAGVPFPSADVLDDWLSSNTGQDIILQTLDPNVDHLDFVQTPSVGDALRRLLWNDTDKTLNLGVSADVVLQIGQEQLIYVKNESGGDILDGQVVSLIGSTGSNTTIELADADLASADSTLGLATEDIPNNGFGFVNLQGYVRGIDTSHLTEGGKVWLSSVAGDTTDVKPTAPTHAVFIGYCVREHASQGVILCGVQLGYTLDELHNLAILTPKGGDYLQYDQDVEVWRNQPLTATFELIDASTADWYPPLDITIDSILSQKNAGTITVLVNDAAYVYTDPINAYDKVTVSTDAPDVITFDVTATNIVS